MKATRYLLFFHYILADIGIDMNLQKLVNTGCFTKLRINLDEPCRDIKLMKKCQYKTCVVPRFDYSEEKNVCKVGKPHNNTCVYYKNNDKKAIGVDLKQAKQVYSGYKDGASGIWKRIYKETENHPMIGKLISGLHFSITIHISVYYKFVVRDYMSNPMLYYQKYNQEHYNNLLFALNLVRYAVGSLDKSVYRCSLQLSDHDMGLLSSLIARARSTSKPSIQLANYETVFRNISELLNCIECDKCKLWGKIQFIGLKVALDIVSGSIKHISGNDLVYIIQLLYKLESSVYFAAELHKKIKYRHVYFVLLYYVEIATLFISLALFYTVNKICTGRSNINKEK